jgi:quercetin dioxygenase-like cupin family protein
VSGEGRTPVFVAPGSGRTHDFLSVTHKLTTAETGGSYYLFESTFEPGDSNRLHVHRDADEIGYVIDGALEVRLGSERHVLEAGGVAHLPKGIAHGLRNPLETPARYLFVAIPAGLDRWFDALDDARRAGTLDDETFDRLASIHGIDFLE